MRFAIALAFVSMHVLCQNAYSQVGSAIEFQCTLADFNDELQRMSVDLRGSSTSTREVSVSDQFLLRMPGGGSLIANIEVRANLVAGHGTSVAGLEWVEATISSTQFKEFKLRYSNKFGSDFMPYIQFFIINGNKLSVQHADTVGEEAVHAMLCSPELSRSR